MLGQSHFRWNRLLRRSCVGGGQRVHVMRRRFVLRLHLRCVGSTADWNFRGLDPLFEMEGFLVLRLVRTHLPLALGFLKESRVCITQRDTGQIRLHREVSELQGLIVHGGHVFRVDCGV